MEAVEDLSALIELIAVAVLFIGVGAFFAAPMLFAGWAEGRRDKFEEDIVCQSEIARRVAIAEAAIEARNRGEQFVPPDDYAR